ncbi:MAG TPA: winged helix-turn-helix domain-containing protein [Casimicrobiaceae bacterium]|nr:winged helix-turn-helix domain-containing protein [Casimicrobiaceae bacterium]
MTTVLRFGRVEIAPAVRRVRVDGREVPLGGRAFDVLAALVERRDRIVTKDELLAAAWPDVIVEDNNLQVQISALRRALGHDAIATIAGRGYLLRLEPDRTAPSADAAVGLPAPVTSLVGREAELAELAGMLEHRRLVTLVGVGGIGKTSLALALARSAAGRYRDGAWFADLSQLADPQLVPASVASVLGVEDVPGTPPLELIRHHVAPRQPLLVLDNCEHLLRACGELAHALLQAAPEIVLVATSREPLHIAGEATFHVPTLRTPDARQPMAAEALREFAAVRVFLDRAVAAHAGFALAPDNADAVAQICRDVDGIPLALELAAARVRTVPVSAIAQRLADRFRVLKSSDPTALPRHQTLRATLDWSYELLSRPEQTLLRRLSACAGGFTLDAAEAIGEGIDEGEEDVLDLLGHLVDKSLVVIDARSERYRLLETVRQYALERLAQAGEESAARASHLRYFAQLARSATDDELSGLRQPEWQLRFEHERDNFLAMHAHGRDAEDGAAACLALAGMFRWLPLTQHAHWHAVCEEALAHPGAQEATPARSRALVAACFLSNVIGRFDEARRFAEEALAIAERTGNVRSRFDAHRELGNVLLALRPPDALAHARAAYAFARANGGDQWIAHGATTMGEAYAAQGRYDLAEPYYAESLERGRGSIGPGDVAVALFNLVLCAAARGAVGKGVAHLREAIPLGDAARATRHAIAVVHSCGMLAALRGDGVPAARLLGASAAVSERHALPLEASVATVTDIAVERARALLDPAAFGATWAAGRALEIDAAFAEACAWLDGIPA